METLLAGITTQDLRELALTAGGIATAIVAIAAAYRTPVGRPLRWFVKTATRSLIADPLTRFFHHVLDLWWHESPQAQRLERIEGEFRNNGGTTLRDGQDRLSDGLRQLDQRLEEHTGQDAKNFAAIDERMATIQAALCDPP